MISMCLASGPTVIPPPLLYAEMLYATIPLLKLIYIPLLFASGERPLRVHIFPRTIVLRPFDDIASIP